MRHRRTKIFLQLSLALVLTLQSFPAFAALKSWNVNSGIFTVNGNWSPASKPVAGDDAYLTNAISGNATITSGGNSTMATLIISNTTAFSHVFQIEKKDTITVSGTTLLGRNAVLMIGGAAGNISANDAATLTTANFYLENNALIDFGEAVAAKPVQFIVSGVFTNTSQSSIQFTSDVVEAAMKFTSTTQIVTNQGTISFRPTNAASLTVLVGAAGALNAFHNSGTFDVILAGTLANSVVNLSNRLVNANSLMISNSSTAAGGTISFVVGAGITNLSTGTIKFFTDQPRSGINNVLTLNTGNLVNLGTISFTAYRGTNANEINVRATGAAFSNAATGHIVLQSSNLGTNLIRAAQVANHGTITISGGTLLLQTSSGAAQGLHNAGIIEFAAGNLIAANGITNASGGVIRTISGGTGTLISQVLNQSGGELLASNATTMVLLVAPVQQGDVTISNNATLKIGAAGTVDWTNNGTIFLNGGNIQSGNLNNNATIGGNGVLSMFILNQSGGTIDATNGILTLNVNPSMLGTVITRNDGSLKFGATGNLVVTNAGVINFYGGTFIAGELTNLATRTINTVDSDAAVISNRVVNAGIMNITNALLTVTGGVTNGPTGTINLRNTGTLAGGALTNAGLIAAFAGGNIDAAVVNRSSLTVSNGTLRLALAPVQGGTVNVITTGVLHVVQDWQNSGLVAIAGGGAVTGGAFTNAASATTTNLGFILSQVVNQGRFDLAGTVSNNLTQTAGSLTVSGRATVTGATTIGGGALDLLGNRITNGLLVISGAGVVTNAAAGATVDGGVSNANLVAITGNTFFNGPVTNTGALFFQGAISNSLVNAGSFNLNNHATLTAAPANTGTIDVRALILTVTRDWANSGTILINSGELAGANLTNNANIAGSGLLSGRLVNQGLLTVSNGTLTVAQAPGLSSGGVSITPSGVLNVTPDWSSSGTIALAGGAAITGGTLTNASATGTLSGSGFINPLLVNQGRMDFGGTISNNFIQTAGSFTLSGNSTITGTARISGGAVNLLGNRLTNALLIVSSGGVLTNSVIGATVNGGVSNAATVFVSANTFFNGALTNTGTFSFRGAISNAVANAGTLVANSTATITGSLVNDGGLLVTNGTLFLLSAPTQNGTLTVATSGTLNVAPAWNNFGTVNVQGGVIEGGNLTNAAGGLIRNAGTITALVINNGILEALGGNGLTLNGTTNSAGSQILISNSTVRTTSLLRNAGNFTLLNSVGTLQAGALNTGSMLVSNIVTGLSSTRLVVSGSFTNTGTLSFIRSVGEFYGTVVNSGTWITDPTTNIYNDTRTDTDTGVIHADPGDVFLFRENFINLSTASNDWNTLNVPPGVSGGDPTKFIFDDDSANGTQQFFHAGVLLTGGFTGTPNPTSNGLQFVTGFSTVSGFQTNFALGRLEVGNAGTNSTLQLLDSYPADGRAAALFVNDLWLFGSSHLILSNNFRLYFVNSNDWTMANITLLGNAQIHQLSPLITMAVPEPNVLLLWLGGAVAMYGARQRSRPRPRRPTPAPTARPPRVRHRVIRRGYRFYC